MQQTVKYYLATYNLVAFFFWAAFLGGYLYSGFEMNRVNLLLLNIAQGMALLEVVHAIFGWVRSPVVSTLAQVASRIMVLVFINVFLLDFSAVTVFKAGLVIVSFAWGITELVRYSLYFLSLFNKQPRVLLWMRYSFFILLYPLGVTGEWLILVTPPMANGISFNAYGIFLVVNFLAYAYYFPVLYRYMWSQRKTKLLS